MGRYYCGQISGKFWFGVQCSNDASYFGVKHTDVVQYLVCGCELDAGLIEHITNGNEISISINSIGLFCRDCFESIDEHKRAMLEDDIDYDENTWRIADNEVYYEFEVRHINIVHAHVQQLEFFVGKYMESYIIKDNGDNSEITYYYKCPEELSAEELILVARLCLGKQILYCLQMRGQCHFTAEL